MIRFTNVNKIYDNGTHAIKGVSFLVDNGEFVFLVGPSGSGKSTILKLLTAEEPITRGSAVIDGFDLRHIQPSRIPLLRRRVGVVYQDFRLIKNKTVLVIAHRMRTVSGADKVAVLSDGIVAEQGSPKELTARGKLYPHMLRLQMMSRNWEI